MTDQYQMLADLARLPREQAAQQVQAMTADQQRTLARAGQAVVDGITDPTSYHQAVADCIKINDESVRLKWDEIVAASEKMTDALHLSNWVDGLMFAISIISMAMGGV